MESTGEEPAEESEGVASARARRAARGWAAPGGVQAAAQATAGQGGGWYVYRGTYRYNGLALFTRCNFNNYRVISM